MGVCKVCGCNDGAAKDARSVPQIRRYFAVLKLVFESWPEGHPEQFSDHEEMRAWLQMKAGYRIASLNMPVFGIRPHLLVILIREALKAVGSHARPIEYRGRLIIWKPKSISFGAMPHAEFCKLVDDVEAVIEAETGIKIAELEQVAA